MASLFFQKYTINLQWIFCSCYYYSLFSLHVCCNSLLELFSSLSMKILNFQNIYEVASDPPTCHSNYSKLCSWLASTDKHFTASFDHELSKGSSPLPHILADQKQFKLYKRKKSILIPVEANNFIRTSNLSN